MWAINYTAQPRKVCLPAHGGKKILSTLVPYMRHNTVHILGKVHKHKESGLSDWLTDWGVMWGNRSPRGHMWSLLSLAFQCEVIIHRDLYTPHHLSYHTRSLVPTMLLARDRVVRFVTRNSYASSKTGEFIILRYISRCNISSHTR